MVCLAVHHVTAAEPETETEAEAEAEVEPPRPRRNIVDPELVPSSNQSQTGTIEFVGLNALTEEEARNAINFQARNLEENGVTMARADDAAFFLEKTLRGQGFKTASVTWKIAAGNRVILTVDEGIDYLFGDVTVTGNSHLSNEAVRELMTQATRKRLGYQLDAPEIPYVAADVDDGIKATLHLYQLLGYAKAQVELSDTVIRSESRTVDLAVTVVEGVPSQIGKIQFPPSTNDEVRSAYEGINTEFTGKPFTSAVRANLENQIIEAAHESGYLDATLEIEPLAPRTEERTIGEEGESQSVQSIDLKIKAEWGRQYTLKLIHVSGVEKINDGIIEARFDHLLDQVYSPKLTNVEITSLLESGAFETFSAEPVPQEDGSLTLEIDATESMQRSLGVYGGFGSYEGIIIGLEYRNSNFLHRLHTFQAALELTGRGLSGDIENAIPRFLGSRWRFVTGIESGIESNEGYDNFETAFRIGFQRDLGEKKRHSFTLFANPAYGEVTDADIADALLGPKEYLVSRAGILYSFDGRDDPVSPRRGFTADLALIMASSGIGSEVEFGKASLRTGYHLPLGKTTLRLGARAGIIQPENEDELLPIDLRFFSGGARSVRSFRERDLGPRDSNGYPLGGEFMTVFNIEYEIPVAGPMSIAPFVDAGNLLPRAEDASLDEMHYAGGAALIINSPIGPFRFDYGHNLNRGENEPSGTWHVGFGFAF